MPAEAEAPIERTPAAEPVPEAAPADDAMTEIVALADLAPAEVALAEETLASGEADHDGDEAAEAEPEPPAPGFAELGLSEPILRAVAEKGYLTPTPIQQQAIPFILMGRDVLGVAQTGTGKTAGFTLPMLDILSGSRARARMPRSLILEPTRELALQVAENFVMYGKYLKFTHALIIGGESMSDQKDLLMKGVDVLIATPGRLIDMFERGGLLLTDCRTLVIDEADRMLDMGFIPDVERIVAMLPATRQTLFFSATMAPEIRRLSDAFLQNPKLVTVSKAASVAPTIIQKMTLVAETDKREALRRLIRSEDVQNALIFCNRKRDVDILNKSLNRHGFSVGALHGDLAQSVRFATLEKFKAGELRLLCCSDVAARGIDIGGLSHVFNFDVPIHPEDYVHRIGRTGRAGREGRTFMLASPDDRVAVEAIEKLTGFAIDRIQVEGLDAVEWSEGGKRGRGRKPAAGRSAAAKPEPKADAKPAGRGERKPARKAEVRTAPEPAPAVIEIQAAPPPSPARIIVREGRQPEPRREDRSRHDRPREDRPRDDRGREDRGRDDRGRDDRAREERARADAPRDDRPREERPRRRDDDLGPSVLGFGGDTPAFMLVAARRRPAMSEAQAESQEA